MDAGTMQTFTQLISTVGFPIVCSGALFWLMNKQAEEHKEEMTQLKDVISQNTVVLAELKQMIKDMTDDDRTNHAA